VLISMTMAAMPAIFFIDVPLVVDCRPALATTLCAVAWFASRRCDLLNAALRLSAGSGDRPIAAAHCASFFLDARRDEWIDKGAIITGE
jgi:hypothetical protein